MTDETLTGDGQQAPRPTGGGLAAVLAPEGVAAILAVIVVVVLLASRLSAGGGVAVATPSPTPTPVPTATPAPGVDTAAIAQLLRTNGRLTDLANVIQSQIDAKQVDPPTLICAYRQIISELTNAGDGAARDLAASHGGAEVGQIAIDLYANLRKQAGDAINSLDPNDYTAKSLADWKQSAILIAKTLELIPDLNNQLVALEAAASQPSPSPSTEPSSLASPSVLPSASVAPSPSVLPSPTAVPPPTATPVPVTPPPASVAPTVRPSGSPGASPALGPNMIQNGSFDSGTQSPWELVSADPAAHATATLVVSEPYSPKYAARIDIQAPSNRAIGLTYRQSGFQIIAGANYQVTIALRASDLRTVRVRVADAETGQVVGSKVIQVGTTWSVTTFPVGSFVGSDFATFGIDVGESGETVWVDDVVLARVSPV